ncbi:MAG: hypothetical protein ACK5LR_00580 [Mangrovibacterium sp.]
MALGDNLSAQFKAELFKTSLSKGDVFLNKFDTIDHPKFFIVAGLSGDKVFTCSVYINSNIHPSIQKKQELLNLQVPIKGSKYKFLTHDSFVCCSTPLPIKSELINLWIENKSCQVKGKIDDEDLENIQLTIINSGLLTEEEIELYFTR